MATKNVNESRENANLAQQYVVREAGVFWSKDHRHHSARAMTDRRGNTLGINFSGSVSLASMDVLERRVLPDRRGLAVSLERMDKALTMFGGLVAVNPLHFPDWTPPAAVIVREDQMDYQRELSRQMAMLGLIRVPFLTSQLEWAQAFVDQIAAEHPKL